MGVFLHCSDRDSWNILRDMAPAVRLQEFRNPPDGLAQIIFMRQKHNAEVVRLWPVKARALHQHHPR